MPATLTPQITTIIAEGVKAGEWPEQAAARLGVPTAQWCSWHELGQRLSESAATGELQDDLTPHEQLCLALVHQVQRAEAECEHTWITNWRTSAAAGRGNAWTSYATMLERRFPERWSKRPQEAVRVAEGRESIEQALLRLQRERDGED